MLKELLITLATSAVVLTPFSARASEVKTNPQTATISAIPLSPYVQDIQGWNGLNWGITKDEALKVFPDLTVTDDRWLKGTYTLAKIPCALSLRFELGKLTGVFLLIKGQGYDDAAFTFKELLRDKYGPPTKLGGLESKLTKDTTWTLPSTEINLHVRTFPGDKNEYLTMLGFSKREQRNDI